MKCNEAREIMPDLAADVTPVTPEVKAHLDSCSECAGKLEAFRQTMSLLDEWQTPEPTPYFDVRLRARLREESAKQSTGWLRWMRRPVLAASFALVLVAGVSLVRMNSGERGTPAISMLTAAAPGTAVGDLQALDKNQNLYSDFDVLDDLAVQPDVTANP
jgi:predicted anti-sigma-YlaC factor YlaD